MCGVQGWQRFTSGRLEVVDIDGHHMWPMVPECKQAWLVDVAKQISSCLQDVQSRGM
jgi:hypothetical protein